MKFLALIIGCSLPLLATATVATATNATVIDSYKNVVSASCKNATDSLDINVETKVISGSISDSHSSVHLDNNYSTVDMGSEKIVEIIPNFLQTGIDLLAGLVVNSDVSSFGTFGIVLDKELNNPHLTQPMRIVYIEGMTGNQWECQMDCQFTTKP